MRFFVGKDFVFTSGTGTKVESISAMTKKLHPQNNVKVWAFGHTHSGCQFVNSENDELSMRERRELGLLAEMMAYGR